MYFHILLLLNYISLNSYMYLFIYIFQQFYVYLFRFFHVSTFIYLNISKFLDEFLYLYTYISPVVQTLNLERWSLNV